MTDPAPSLRNDRRNILLLGLVSFINDTSSKIILPVLPLFLAHLGAAGAAIGIISGISDSVAGLLKMFAGYWSDRSGRRLAFVYAGYGVASVAKFLFAFAGSWPQVLVLRTAERFGKGLRSAPRDAVLAASTVRHRRGRGFGVHRAMDSGGAVLGTLVAFGLFWYLHMGFSEVFLIAGLVGFVSLLPLIWVREHGDGPPAQPPRISLRALAPRLRLFMGVAFLFALANFSYMFFVLRSQTAFTGTLAVAAPILLYGLYNLSFTLFALPAGILSDRIGRRAVLMVGYGLFGLVSLGFMFAHTTGGFVTLFLLYGLSYALIEANERAYVSDLAAANMRGTALGTYHMATSVAALPAGLAAGLLWDAHPTATFAYGAVMAFSAAALLWVVARRDGDAGEEHA